MSADILWYPNDTSTQLHQFAKEQGFDNYNALWRWSVERRDVFWDKTWNFCNIIAEKKGEVSYEKGETIQDDRYFPHARLNYAENLLRRRDDGVAIIFNGENKVQYQLSYEALYDQVSQFTQALKNAGVEQGDRVAGYMPNMPETVVAMLATAALGAIWSSASPDFGVQGVLDRFSQIEPKVLIAAEGYYYNGKEINCLDKLSQILPKLPSVEKTIIVPYVQQNRELEVLGQSAVHYDDFLSDFEPQTIEFSHVPFKHPLFIMFSSGTTGAPKCIVHGHGGTLIQHAKEHRFHCNIKPNDKVFYFTTCGWMMWNWLVSALASEATLMLYDGSPFYPDGNCLFDFAQEHKCSFFGVSAKYIDALKKAELAPCETHDLSSIRMIASTGSPLVHEGFDYIYNKIKPDVHVASISGGTDIVSCFVLGNPMVPVHRGEIQGPGLGMDIDIFDAEGRSQKRDGGELVCKTSFPAMPVGFWNDLEGEKYFKAYFDKFKNIWCHGDWCQWSENNGLIIHGRSDATLNPGGVRIGTSEIYRQVEKLTEVKESIAIGQDFDSDVRVVLFVILAKNQTLTDDLERKIKSTIREGASPRHVPAKIIQVSDIPRTKSGKITELAVRDIVHGRCVKNVESLANPDALSQYKNIAELAS